MRRRRHRDEKIERLAAAPVLRGWSEADLLALGRAGDLVDACAGQELTAGSHAGQWWWLVLRGELELVVEGRGVAAVGAGHFLRPDAGHADPLREATLRASSPAAVLTGRVVDLDDLGKTRPRLLRLMQQLPVADRRPVDIGRANPGTPRPRTGAA